jgi:hypothetical protein
MVPTGSSAWSLANVTGLLYVPVPPAAWWIAG